MTDKTPPITFGTIRVIIRLEGEPRHFYADLATSELPQWLDNSLDNAARLLSLPPLIKGTDQGATTARKIFMKAAGMGVDGCAMICCSALWIALDAPPFLPGYDLSVDDLHAAAGTGIIRIYPRKDFMLWEFNFQCPEIQQHGRKDIAQGGAHAHWAAETKGTA